MILITGIAHTGSSVLLLLLEALGYSIGREQFPDPYLELLREPRLLAMLERGETPVWPDAIKHLGGFCYHLSEHVERWKWNVEHVVVMTRDLETSISRREKFENGRDFTPRAFGKTTDEWKRLTQEQRRGVCRDKLREQLGALMFNLIPTGYPFSCLEYPRWVHDPEYTFQRLSPPLHDKSAFMEAFKKVIDPSRVGTY